MKIYVEYKNNLLFDGMIIPKDTGNKHYREFLKMLSNGEAELVPFVALALTWEEIRAQRDALLKDCDWTTTIDANPKPSKEAWLTYRQALRDVPQNFTTAEEVVWPSTPE